VTIIKPSHHLDRLGYYEVGNNRYLHKLSAYRAADYNLANIKFVFNDHEFDSYDWTQDPDPNVGLTEFYRQRAQALRDKYEYLVLMYSGGPDSKNVLDCFLQNNIQIDEVINFNSFEKTRHCQGTINNADYVYNAQPTLEELRRTNPEIRITVADEIDITQRYQQRLQQQGDFEFVVGLTGSINSWVYRGVWIRHVDHIWNKMQSGVRVGVIKAHDKPKILVDSAGRYYTQFNDINGADLALALSQDNDLCNTEFLEFFYNGTESVPLMIKQLHVLKNFMSQVQDPDKYEDQKTHDMRSRSRIHFTCVNRELGRNLKYDEFHQIIYPGSKPLFRTPKTLFGFSSRPEDTWWLGQLEPEYTSFWYKSLYKAVQFANIKHHHSGGADVRGLPFIKSKPIYLE
jgi:hypothetical protein